MKVIANSQGKVVLAGGKAFSIIAEENDVIFIDYDGAIRYSYSAADFANLTAMPANPTHQGLTAQGWNWTLVEAKAYVASYGKLVIGQMYITSDGKTRIYIRLEDGRLSPMLGIGLNGTAVVDWGDGTTSTITGSNVSTTAWTDTHNYASPGDYVIAISVDGSMCLNSGCPLLRYSSDADEHRNYVYRNSIQKVEIGSGVVAISSNALSNCYSLQSITIPSGVTIGSTAFQSCSSLSSITIPSGVTEIDQTVFQYCNALSRVALPPSITNIRNYAFEKCYSLLGVTIPSGVTSIGSSAFINCWALSSLTIPAGATVNSNAFAYCYSLTKVVTQSGTIESGEFRYCYSLTNVTIPSGVTSIGGNTFGSCWGLSKLYLLPTTPPTLATSSFSGTPADMVIYVPYSADHSILTAYQTATNWSTYAGQIYELGNPTGCTRIEYAATDSSAWLDTGIAGATDLEIYVRFSYDTYIQYGQVYHNYIDDNHKTNRVLLGSSESSFMIGDGDSLGAAYGSYAATKKQHGIKVSLGSAVIDGNSVTVNGDNKTVNTTNIVLGNRSTTSPIVRDIGLHIYRFLIKKAGTIVLDLVPVKSNGVAGFWDYVSASFKPSSSGTAFTAGPDLNI